MFIRKRLHANDHMKKAAAANMVTTAQSDLFYFTSS